MLPNNTVRRMRSSSAATLPPYTLVVTVPGQPPASVVIAKPRATLGRDGADVVVADPRCSTAHAELLWDGRRVIFRDLGSTNGSFVFGQRVEEVEFQLGTSIRIGESTVLLSAVDRSAVARASGSDSTFIRTAKSPRPQSAARPRSAPRSATRRPRRAALGLLAGLVVLIVALGGAGLALSRREPGHRGSVPSVGPAAVGGEANVKAVWFRGQPGVSVEGGTSDIGVRVAPNKQVGASVGVVEEFSGGTGSQWRTATWMAAFNASRASGHSLVEHEFLVRAGGHIDGPSAGMMMTATMLALLRGKQVLPGTTMTGTINPDGSAGPVGGIVQKMKGAKASGITRFGYPLGARNHVDLADMQPVDLNAVGKELGIEVREIDDLDEAYEFLTGDRLTHPDPLPESELELDLDVSQRLRAKLTTWKARLQREVTVLKDLMRKNPAIAQAMAPHLGQISKLVDQAALYERGDYPAAALNHYVKAELLAKIAQQGIGFTNAMLSGDSAGVDAMVNEATSFAGLIDGYGEELMVKARGKTVGGQVNTTLALTAYVTASNFARLGDAGRARAREVAAAIRSGKLKPSADALSYVGKNLIMPIAYYHCAKVMVELSRDLEDVLGEEGASSQANLVLLGREAGAYGSAAGAALGYFDALVTEQYERKGLTRAQAQAVVADKELGYVLARQSTQLTEGLKPDAQDGLKNLLRLAAGANAYITASSLVNKHYALGATVASNGDVTLTQRKSLVAQLEQARIHAREAAAQARQVAGFVPAAARFDYQYATAMRDGSDADKLDALEAYWTSAFWSELAAKVASR